MVKPKDARLHAAAGTAFAASTTVEMIVESGAGRKAALRRKLDVERNDEYEAAPGDG